MPSRRTALGLLSALPLLGFARPVQAATSEVFVQAGLAIGGTDPLAYFRQGAAVPGSADFALRWRGAVWTFASAENLAAFEMNPDAFAPQFGGYCAYSLAHGALSSTVPEAWCLYQNRLYLTHSLAVRDEWQADIAGFLALATPHWPAILQS